MKKQNVFGYLLFLDMSREKRQTPSRGKVKKNYKELHAHIVYWQEALQRMLKYSVTTEDSLFLCNFIDFIQSQCTYLLYPNAYQAIMANGELESYTPETMNEKIEKINCLMLDLVEDLLQELKPRYFVNGRRIYYLLRSLHNLPRVYPSLPIMGSEVNNRIRPEDAVRYTFDSANMDKQTLEKYDFIRKEIINLD